MTAISSSHSERRILMISYYYAPIENPGTRRVGAFVRYLPQYGYRAVALTTSSYGALADDEERLVFRAPDVMDVGRWLARRIKKVQPTVVSEPLSPIVTPDSMLSRALERILIPDIHIGWLPGAVLRGRQLLRTGTFRAIFSSSPPPSSHLVALALKRLSGLPWVADFRDGWTFEPPDPATLSSPARLRIERALERAVVLGADRIVTVNQVLADDLRCRYPTATVVVISNGYDPAEVATLRPHTKGKRLQIVHTGALARSRSHTRVSGLMAALDRLQQTQSSMLTDLEICFIGNLGTTERKALARNGCQSCITVEGPIPHRETLQRQVEADVLLLITAPNAISVTTSKLFEYLASGRPILALTGRSAAAALIEEFNAGIVVAPDDVDGICQALEWFYDRWLANDLPTRVDPRVQRFDRRNLTGELAKVFDALI